MPTMYRGPANPNLSSGTPGGSSTTSPRPTTPRPPMNRPTMGRGGRPNASSGGPGHVGNYGGDAHSYLGHFRSPAVARAGHNQMLPGVAARVNKVAKSGVDVNAATNPVLAARVARRNEVKAAKATGLPGAAKQAREAAAPSIKAAKKTRAGFTAKDKQTQSSALKATLLGATNALKANRQGMAKAMGGSMTKSKGY